MSSISGDIPQLALPPLGDDVDLPPEVTAYLTMVTNNILEYTEQMSAKVQEIESISVNGQGLNLTIWPANAKLTKRDGVAAIFDGEPNVGTPGAGVQGWYAWVEKSQVWVKI